MSKRPNPEMIDDENPEWTAGDFKTATPFTDLSTSLQAKLRGRPKGSNKTQITLRVDNDTLAAFRALGGGWQTRMNQVLKDWVKAHSA